MNYSKKSFLAMVCILFVEFVYADNVDSALYRAVKAGNVSMVEQLLANHVDIDYENSENKTALHCAVENKYVDIVKMLIHAGADVNVHAWYGWTPLHYAVYVGSSEIVGLLLEAKARINSTNSYGFNALGLAVYYDKVAIARYLFASGALLRFSYDEISAVWDACKYNKINMLKFLIDYEVDLDVQDNDEPCWTVLHYATNENKYEVVKILLAAGASTHIKDCHGFLAENYAQNDKMKALFQK